MKPTSRTLSWAFVIILLVVGIFTALGMILMHKQPLVLQGEAEATEIRISGKLPGRIDTFLVQEGDWVRQGDTLVVINSPEVHAKFQQVNALEQVAVLQNKKIDAGTRRQIVATALQLWNKTKSDLSLAKITYNRILTLYKDSVVTSQRKDEVEAMYKAALAAERAAYEQYQMAVDGAQTEDKASAASMVDAARSTVDEVSALLVDARLTAPEDGQIATIFPKRGELVAPGTPIMNLVVTEGAGAPPPDKNVGTPPDKIVTTPPDKNVGEINTRSDHIPPIVPQGGPPKKKKAKSVPAWKPERFERFWAYYPRHEDRVSAVREWDRLKPGDELIDAIARALLWQTKEPDWPVPYACRYLRNQRWTDEPPRPRAQGRPAAQQMTGWHMAIVDGEEVLVPDESG